MIMYLFAMWELKTKEICIRLSLSVAVLVATNMCVLNWT